MGEWELKKIFGISLWWIGGIITVGILSSASLIRYNNRKKYEKKESFHIDCINKREKGRSKKKI